MEGLLSAERKHLRQVHEMGGEYEENFMRASFHADKGKTGGFQNFSQEIASTTTILLSKLQRGLPVKVINNSLFMQGTSLFNKYYKTPNSV